MNPAFILAADSLTYDPAEPNFCTDEAIVCYGPKVVPPPTPGGGGSGGASTGGWGDVCIVHCDEDGNRLCGDDPDTEVVHVVETADGGSVKIHPENVIDPKELEALRQQIDEYRQEVEQLKAAPIPRRSAIDGLRKKILDLEKLILEARETIARQAAKLAELTKQTVAAVPEFSADALADMIAQALAANPAVTALNRTLAGMAAAPVVKDDSLTELVAAAALGLATCYLVPDDAPALKVIGYSAATYFALSGLSR